MSVIKLVISTLRFRKSYMLTGVLVLSIVTAVFYFSQQTLWGMREGIDKGVNRLGADIILLPQKMGSTIENMLFSSEPMNVYLKADFIEDIGQIKGISVMSPQFFAQTLNQDCCSLGRAYRLVGFDSETDFVLKSWLDQNLGRPLKADEIIIGAEIPNFLGDRAVILEEQFKVAGKLEKSGSDSLDNTVFMTIDTARRLAQNSPYVKDLWEDGYSPENLVSAVLIKIESQQDLLPVTEKLSKLPGVSVSVMSNVARQAKNNIIWVSDLVVIITSMLWILAVIAVGNHFLMEIMRRKTEIGVIRAVGGSSSSILLIFFCEALVMSMIGVVIGLPTGQLMLKVMGNWMTAKNVIPFAEPSVRIILQHSAASLMLTLGTGAIGVLYPAYVAVRVDPATVIARGEAE